MSWDDDGNNRFCKKYLTFYFLWSKCSKNINRVTRKLVVNKTKDEGYIFHHTSQCSILTWFISKCWHRSPDSSGEKWYKAEHISIEVNYLKLDNIFHFSHTLGKFLTKNFSKKWFRKLSYRPKCIIHYVATGVGV